MLDSEYADITNPWDGDMSELDVNCCICGMHITEKHGPDCHGDSNAFLYALSVIVWRATNAVETAVCEDVLAGLIEQAIAVASDMDVHHITSAIHTALSLRNPIGGEQHGRLRVE